MVCAHPLSRLERVADGWLLMRVGERIGYRVDTLTAAVLVRAASPITKDALVAALGEYGRERIWRTVDLLVTADFLAPVAQAKNRALRDELREWEFAGWEAAAQYHFQTFGYEFETYNQDGSSHEDAKRMLDYAAEQPDTDRAKSYEGVALETRTLPRPGPDLAPEPVVGGVSPRPLSADCLAELLSLLACPTQEKGLPWPGAKPVLRKTSPSGGSRHPTEMYLRVIGVGGLTNGWWHIAAREHRLERITSLVDPLSGLDALLPGQTPARPQALVLYTCVFARNRYRYREPRTFRTVHMDVGHLMGTCEFLATSRGLTTTPVTRLNTWAFATALTLDPLVECPIAATILHDGADT